MKPVPVPSLATPETPTIRGWIGDAVSVRDGRFYVCFEEPRDPFFVPERKVVLVGYNERYCRKDHPYLPCGWYRLVAE